jgi:hypothetical protein
MNTNDLLNKNNAKSFEVAKDCAVCGNNRGAKKRTIFFRATRSAKVCVMCALRFNSTQEILDWLRTHAVFDKYGSVLYFSKETQRNLDTSANANESTSLKKRRNKKCGSITNPVAREKPMINHSGKMEQIIAMPAEVCQSAPHQRNQLFLFNKNKEEI